MGVQTPYLFPAGAIGIRMIEQETPLRFGQACFMTTLLFATTLLAGAAVAQPLRVTMISLGVKDIERSVQFYTNTLGLSLVGKPGEVTLVKAGDVTIALNAPLGRSAGEKMAGAFEVILSAASVEALHRELAARAATLLPSRMR